MIILKDQNTEPRERKQEAADTIGAFIKQQRDRDSLLSNFIGVALSSYMNGINDATRSYKAALQPGG